jgi:hypothetical protein
LCGLRCGKRDHQTGDDYSKSLFALHKHFSFVRLMSVKLFSALGKE